jgi:hypothetical protein
MSRRINRWGTFFLVFAASGFAFFTFQPWWSAEGVRFFRAFFEASLVGALADWFAVTALFKRPLGLPLPHTDVLVSRKDQLAAAIPQFVASFLEPQRLHPVLRQVDWAGVLLDRLEPEALDGLFGDALEILWEAPGRPAWEQGAIGLGADLLYRELVRHKEALVGPVTDLVKKNAGWKGLFVSRDTVDEAVAGFLEELRAVRDNQAHGLRPYLASAFHQAWPALAAQLKPSKWTAGTWSRLAADPSFRQGFNAKAGEAAVALWERTGAAGALTSALGYLLAQTDARSLADRIEAAVRNDLQYIRVNGALVGGLAGLGLELIRFAAT